MNAEGAHEASRALTGLIGEGLTGLLAVSGFALLCTNIARPSASNDSSSRGASNTEPPPSPRNQQRCSGLLCIGVVLWVLSQLLIVTQGVLQPCCLPVTVDLKYLDMMKVLVPGAPALLAYILARCFLVKDPLPQSQTSSALLCWLGVGLVERFGPRPDASILQEGLEGLTKGRSGGARGPFVVYLVAWTFACASLCLAIRDGTRSPSKNSSRSSGRLSRIAPALLCISMFSLAHLVLGLGAVSSRKSGWDAEVVSFAMLGIGGILSVLGFISAWYALRHQEIPLSIFWPLTVAGSLVVGILQDHLFYHDLVWMPAKHGSSGMSSFALGTAFLLGTIGMLLKDLLHSRESGYKPVPVNGNDPCPDLHTRSVATSRHWTALLICLLAYYEGVTQPLVQVAHSPYLSMHKHPGDLTKSNFELIQYLYEKRMPFAALVVALCSAIIPAFKFTGTVLVMMPPKFMSDEALHNLRSILSIMSPYQFADIFIALLLLAYLNIDALSGASSSTGAVHCIIRSGFVWFLCYCLGSVALAATLEQEPAANDSQASNPPSPSHAQTPTRNRDRANSDGGLEMGATVRRLWGTPPSSSSRLAMTPSGNMLNIDDLPEDVRNAYAAHVAMENQPIIIAVFCLWMLCTAIMLCPFLPLVEVQTRVEGIIIRVQDPPVTDLYMSLRLQSKLLVSIVIVPVLVTPIVYFLSTLMRTSLLQGQNKDWSDWEHGLYVFEQTIKPWVMGDVWGIAVSAFFLSVQEPEHTFVGLSARLPTVPFGFLATLGMGVSTYVLRSLAPPAPRKKPVSGSGGNSPSSTPPRPLPIARQESIVSTLSQSGAGMLICKRFPYGALVVWLLWFLLLWEFGPSAPGEVQSLAGLNNVLDRTVPIANKLLNLHVPQTIGDCQKFALHEQLIHSEVHPVVSQMEIVDVHLDECEGDTPLTVGTVMLPYGIGYLEIDINVGWATGMNTVTINQITVIPHAPSQIDSPFHWALRVQGMFTGLQVWATAKLRDKNVLDAYACCQNPFHFSLQISAACTQEKAFFGNAEVDSLVLDPIEITNMMVLPQVKNEFATVMIDAGNATDTITSAIHQQIKNLLTGKPSGMMKSKSQLEQMQTTTPKPGGHHFNITEMINQVVKFNGGHRCPQMPPTTTSTTAPPLYTFDSPESWNDRRNEIFQ